jgi:mutator family transposase
MSPLPGAATADAARQQVKTFADVLMSAEVDVLCGAEYGERSSERTNSRNGYRQREWDTRATASPRMMDVDHSTSTLRNYAFQPRGCHRSGKAAHPVATRNARCSTGRWGLAIGSRAEPDHLVRAVAERLDRRLAAPAQGDRVAPCLDLLTVRCPQLEVPAHNQRAVLVRSDHR